MRMPPPTTDPAPDWRMANCRTRRIGRGTDEEQPEQRTTERKRPSCLMERIRRKRIHTLASYGMRKVSRNWIALHSRSRLNSFWHPSGCHFAVESFRQHADDDGPVNKQRDVGGNGFDGGSGDNDGKLVRRMLACLWLRISIAWRSITSSTLPIGRRAL